MKKIKIVQFIGIVLFVAYLCLLILDIIWGMLHDYNVLIFSLILAMISVSLIVKGVLLKSSSTLWFAINLISCAIILIVFNLSKIEIANNYYVLSLIPLLASVINLIIFKYIIYFKLIIINISVIIPVYIMHFMNYEWWINLIIFLISITLGIWICRSINLGKEKV